MYSAANEIPPWTPGDVAQVVIGSGALFLAILALVLKYYGKIKVLVLRACVNDDTWAEMCLLILYLQKMHVPQADLEAERGWSDSGREI
jgi:hypothetical protein